MLDAFHKIRSLSLEELRLGSERRERGYHIMQAATAKAHAFKIQANTAYTMILGLNKCKLFSSEPNTLRNGKSRSRLYKLRVAESILESVAACR